MRPHFQAEINSIPSFAFGRMRGLRLRNYVNLLLVFLIVLACFFLYHCPRSLERNVTKVVLFDHRTTSYSGNEELDKVLRRATMPDRTVILTMVDESMASPGSILEILLQSFKSGEGTQRLLNHLVIITKDLQAYEYCISLHPYCTHPSIFPHHNTTLTTNDVLLEVIRLGFNIIFTEADVLWLRSPLINFISKEDLTISCNVLSDEQGRSHQQDGGVFFLKATLGSFAFLKYSKVNKILYPNNPLDESLCTIIRESSEIVGAYSFGVELVNPSSLGGFCQLDKNILMEAYTIHANCCDDLKSKVHDLRIVLDDWIRFTKRAPGGNDLDKMDMRGPQKCSTRYHTSDYI